MDHQQQNNMPYVEILEQPANKGIRFRYECEGRSTGCIPGENSEPEKKTFPSIRIVGYEGRAVIVISCVTKDEPYMPHPHSIVSKEMCSQGVCTVERYTDQEPIVFPTLGIQCVKKKDIAEALQQRKKARVDPFKTGFDINPITLDLSAVRLCFQVFLQGRNGKFQIPLKPVVSNPVYDKKTLNELVICKLSHSSAPTDGGMEMILLCEKVVKDNIQIVFFEMKNDKMVWRDFGVFTPSDVHKQTAIAFRTPRYPIVDVPNPVQVYIQLRRPLDGTTSEPMPFTLIPLDTVGKEIANSLKRKRQKYNTSEVMDSQIYNQPGCKSMCPNQGANAVATTNVTHLHQTSPNEPYRIKLLKQLQAEADSRRDIEMIDRRLNQQSVVNNNRADAPEFTLRNVVPSIFPARFTYNANNKWHNANNQASQYQSRDTSNQYQNREESHQYQNRDISNQYQNGDASNQYQNKDMFAQYQNRNAQQPVVQPNPQCIPTNPGRSMPPPPSASSSSLGISLLPIQRQIEQSNNQNQGPTLYRIQKPMADNNILDNIPSPMDFNSNSLNFDVNPLDVLKELNSEDLAGLSETFSASFSLADPLEFERIKNL
ncbi:putative transcription factor p65 homolog isoform X2 [Chelonus insularis]|uniref:putative transcription factor p65 homolog isoform X2 n=1 Tax=Chelonus insularis TaxID=460826 RepID=UPI00158E5FE1|nr:putative transcription factor p65 homolog isoform X2 [Chelonus insularis]